MNYGARPVIVLGHGVRAAGADAKKVMELGLPVLTSWQAADLVDNWHAMYFGRPGIYGQRCANKVIYEADHVVAIGCRLTPWMIGHTGLRPDQRLTLVEIDKAEAARFKGAEWIFEDAALFINRMEGAHRAEWVAQCTAWRWQYPWVEQAHDDSRGYINSYRVIERLEKLLRPDEIVTTDVGANMCPVFQCLHLRPPQRLLTSGGLGEMGCGLPAAVGASLSRGKAEVLCLVGDGGFLMNLQELQTMVHHELPIKIIVFANDGYGMIKGTHKNLKIPYTGVDRKSGVSMPNFRKVAQAFGIQAAEVRTWEDFDRSMATFFWTKEAALLEVHIDPEQTYVPRLQPIIAADGKITPARFDQLSPVLA